MQWRKNVALIVFNACAPFLSILVASIFQTNLFFDVCAPVIGGILVYATNDEHSWTKARPRYQTYIILIWAARLFFNLFLRNLRMPVEKQVKHVKHVRIIERSPAPIFSWPSWPMCPISLIPLLPWPLQIVSVFLKILPTLLMITAEHQPHVTWQDWIGWLLALTVLLVISLTDFLKSELELNAPKNIEEPADWYYSYKPKVFGEPLFWLGLYISASTAYTSWWMHAVAIGIVLLDVLVAQSIRMTLFEVCGYMMWSTEPSFQIYSGIYLKNKSIPREKEQAAKNAED